MPLEIEKKYLLKRVPSLSYDKVYEIYQYYMENGRYRRTKHIDASNNEVYNYYKTVKTFISPGVNEEIETEINKADFFTNIRDCKNYIHKTRYVRLIGNLKWEIDDFMIGGMRLVIAEVELPKIEDLDTVELPLNIREQLIMDVTHLREFSNFNLSKRP
jgi:CYTH domain-containing protein